MVLGFIKQFKDKILDGSKIHTIRVDGTNRWGPGKKIHFATGIRTKDYNCFKMGECFDVQEITIRKMDDKSTRVFIDLRCLDKEEVDFLALNDGFDDTGEFIKWFIHGYYVDTFYGRIIHWTDFKY